MGMNESEVRIWSHSGLGELNMLFLIGNSFLTHYFFSVYQFSNKTASTKYYKSEILVDEHPKAVTRSS